MAASTLRDLTEWSRRVRQTLPVAAWRRVFPKDVVGLCYHLVSDEDVPHCRHYPILSTSTFEDDIRFLKQHFDFIHHDELAAARSSSPVRRDNRAIITFDDGFSQCADVVAPILSRHGLSGMFFVITDLVDNNKIFRESEASLCVNAILAMPMEAAQTLMDDVMRREEAGGGDWRPLNAAGLGHHDATPIGPLLRWLLTIQEPETPTLRRLSHRLGLDPDAYVRQVRPYLTSDQIRTLHGQGFTIGAHSKDHRRLQDLPRKEVEREIIDSCRIVRDITGQASVPFAFPYSGGGLDREWLADLRRAHDFIGLFFDTGGLVEDEPFVVNRVFGERVGPNQTIDAILRAAWSSRPAWRRSL